MVTEDIRNGNGRAIKSKLWSPNRVDKFEEPVDAIFWLMKDPTMPPILKINGSILSSALGCTLATKRSSAERLAPGVDINALVIEPYANPFRTYPLENDYYKFKTLFEKTHINCYILNTRFLIEKKITPKVTLSCLEAVIENKAIFKQWGNFSNLEIMEVEGFTPDLKSIEYKAMLNDTLNDRVKFLKSREHIKAGYDKVPIETIESIENLIKEI